MSGLDEVRFNYWVGWSIEQLTSNAEISKVIVFQNTVPGCFGPSIGALLLGQGLVNIAGLVREVLLPGIDAQGDASKELVVVHGRLLGRGNDGLDRIVP